MGFKALIVVGAVACFLLAGWLLIRRVGNLGSGGFGDVWNSARRGGLFVDVDPATSDLLLADWRWKVGDDARVFRVTVFGDVFTETADGLVYWLDTGMGRYVEAAGSAEEWASVGRLRGRDWFHWKTLERLRSLGIELPLGEVYSWRQPLFLGGAESVDNVDLVSLVVHVSHAGREAEAVKDLPDGAKIESVDFEMPWTEGSQPTPESGDQDTTVYAVVINSEEQYSMWPADSEIPTGWESVGKTGTKQECLEYIEEVWTDLRPLSIRKKLEGH
jgi:MbtH protein